MTDTLNKAKDLLQSGEHSLVFIRDGKVISSSLNGIRPLMTMLAEDPQAFRGASVADKVIGKAAALLLIYGGVSEVYGGILSERAKTVLENAGVTSEYGQLVPYIVNRAGDGKCPMENKVLDLDDPEEAYKRFSEIVKV